METKFSSQYSILDKLPEKGCLNRVWEGEQGFYWGHIVPPPLPYGAKKEASPGLG